LISAPLSGDWLVEQNLVGKVVNLKKVADEFHEGKDEPATWV